METPPAGPEIDRDGRARARAQVETALAAGRSVLTEPEAKALLAAYGVPIVASDTAARPRARRPQAAVKIGFPVVAQDSVARYQPQVGRGRRRALASARPRRSRGRRRRC